MILQSVKMALKSLRSNKLRFILTMLGIIIGVFALVVLVSLVRGASSSITDSVNELGTDLISVSILDDHSHPIRLDDLSLLADTEGIGLVAAVAESTCSASAPHGQVTAQVTGTTASYRTLQSLKLESGRFLMKPDVDNHTNVAVINHDLAVKILGRTNVVGETIHLNGTSFTVIGVLEENSGSFQFSFFGNYLCYVPYTTLVRLNETTSRNVYSFYAGAGPEGLDAAEEQLTGWLDERFQHDKDAYFLFNQSQISDAMNSITRTLSLLLGGIAGISLLVGGIGIMNIMLVSVTERTKEIGIRKAIGATRGSILLQFLIEALVISLIGCIIGLVLSWFAIQIIDLIGKVRYGINPSIALLSVVFSLLIGVLFGLYPANKASRKPPIESLRYNG